MACELYLRSYMGGEAGGTFAYEGYDASSPNGTYSDNPSAGGAGGIDQIFLNRINAPYGNDN